MRKNTKNTLMIAAAVAALTAGSSLAFAQGTPEGRSNPASKNAPAEKMAPSSGGGAGHVQSGQRGEEKGAAQNHMQGQSGAGERSTVGQGQMNERNRNGQANERSKNGGQAAQEHNNRTKSETTGQAPNQAAPQANPKQQQKGMGNAEQRERNRTTTGQGAPENRGGAMENRREGQGMQERNRTTGQGVQEQRERNRTTGQGAPENRGGAMENRREGGVSGSTTTTERGGSVNLTTEQRTKIHSIIVSERGAPRVEHPDFDVHVGTVVPRGKVHLAPVPSSIVEIQPAWRGFEYFLVGDEIVVVDPSSLHIVAVIPA